MPYTFKEVIYLPRQKPTEDSNYPDLIQGHTFEEGLVDDDTFWAQEGLEASISHGVNDGSMFRPSYYSSTHASPDIFDYVHFAFCYFMFTAFVLFLWLVYMVDLFTNKTENKEVTNETRGYSRAQTGDAITAMIPLTWSLSMVVHAGTNSSNFDENTDNCSLMVNVIAYQWGWNYFIPVDSLIAEKDYNHIFSLIESSQDLSLLDNEGISDSKLLNLRGSIANQAMGYNYSVGGLSSVGSDCPLSFPLGERPNLIASEEEYRYFFTHNYIRTYFESVPRLSSLFRLFRIGGLAAFDNFIWKGRIEAFWRRKVWSKVALYAICGHPSLDDVWRGPILWATQRYLLKRLNGKLSLQLVKYYPISLAEHLCKKKSRYLLAPRKNFDVMWRVDYKHRQRTTIWRLALPYYYRAVPGQRYLTVWYSIERSRRLNISNFLRSHVLTKYFNGHTRRKVMKETYKLSKFRKLVCLKRRESVFAELHLRSLIMNLPKHHLVLRRRIKIRVPVYRSKIPAAFLYTRPHIFYVRHTKPLFQYYRTRTYLCRGRAFLLARFPPLKTPYKGMLYWRALKSFNISNRYYLRKALWFKTSPVRGFVLELKNFKSSKLVVESSLFRKCVPFLVYNYNELLLRVKLRQAAYYRDHLKRKWQPKGYITGIEKGFINVTRNIRWVPSLMPVRYYVQNTSLSAPTENFGVRTVSYFRASRVYILRNLKFRTGLKDHCRLAGRLGKDFGFIRPQLSVPILGKVKKLGLLDNRRIDTLMLRTPTMYGGFYLDKDYLRFGRGRRALRSGTLRRTPIPKVVNMCQPIISLGTCTDLNVFNVFSAATKPEPLLHAEQVQKRLYVKVGDQIASLPKLIREPLPNLYADLDQDFFAKEPSLELISTRSVFNDKVVTKDRLGHGILDHRYTINAGLVLPQDVSIHLVCGSKDVIHSWAIPGLLLKIDCIPGFNSHRRVNLKWSGLYWGQCMEVCGRYHHWMPILVKVVNYDFFISWLLSLLASRIFKWSSAITQIPTWPLEAQLTYKGAFPPIAR